MLEEATRTLKQGKNGACNEMISKFDCVALLQQASPQNDPVLSMHN
jgi:hypothetical protein